jgi:hypothetical protein
MRRKYYSETQGEELIKKYATPQSLAALTLDATLFLALASASALLQYAEFLLSVSFAPRSLKVVLQTLEGRMRIDTLTLKHLEVHSLEWRVRELERAHTVNTC